MRANPAFISPRSVAPSRGRGSKHDPAFAHIHCAIVAPSRGRGSKQAAGEAAARAVLSPLHGGVDRNLGSARVATAALVAPSRGRGSKHGVTTPDFAIAAGSPLHGGVDRNWDRRGRQWWRCLVAPSRGRGSKHRRIEHIGPNRGRPFTGAWIETRAATEISCRSRTSPLHGGVDRNRRARQHSASRCGRPFTGAWIETASTAAAAANAATSPLHGGVDRN